MTVITGIWILISLLGLTYALWDMASAYGHYNLVKQGWPDHARLIEFTKMTLTAQAARSGLLMVFLLLGINAATARNTDLSTIAMFAANGITVYAAIRSHYHREHIFAKERERLKNETQDA